MARGKKTAKEERLLVFSQVVNGAEPKFVLGEVNEKNYREKLMAGLNWYSKESTQDKSKDFFISSDTEYAKYKKIPDQQFGNLGFVVRMVSRGFPETGQIKFNIENKVKFLDNLLEKMILEESKKEVDTSKVKLIDMILMNALEQVDIYIDNRIKSKPSKLAIDLSTLNRSQQLQVKSYVEKNLEEFEYAHKVKDQDGALAYSLSASDCKHIANDFRELLNKLNTSTVTSRKPRAIKAKPISKIVEHVEFSPAHNEFKGLTPDKVVGAKVLLAYHIKGRQSILIYTNNDAGLSFKGKSFINVDEDKSVSKTLRKPDEQLKVLYDSSKLHFERNFSRITAVSRKPRLRTSTDLILLKTWN